MQICHEVSVLLSVSSQYGHFVWQCYLQGLGYVNLQWLPCNWETLRQKDKFSAIYFLHFWELEYISIWFDIMRCLRCNISNGWDHWFPLVVSITPYSWHFGEPWTLLWLWLTCFTCSAVYISTYRLSFRISPPTCQPSALESRERFFPQLFLFLSLLRDFTGSQHDLLTQVCLCSPCARFTQQVGSTSLIILKVIFLTDNCFQWTKIHILFCTATFERWQRYNSMLGKRTSA